MELNQPLGYLLGRSMRIFKILLLTELKKQEIDLSFEQFAILNMLNSDCGLIQQDLANFLQKDKSIIVRQIDTLIDNQLVVRIVNKGDKRKKNLVLTPKGTNILSQARSLASGISKRLLSGVTNAELEVFQKVLSKIQENGDADEELFKS